MLEKDDIQELIREKLQSHEVTPSDAVWKNVSNSLANAAASSGAAASGTSLLLKVAAVVVGVSSIGIAAYFILNGDEGSPNKEIQTIVSPETENSDSENLDENIVTDSAIESQVKSISSNKNTSLEELNLSEPMNSVISEESIIPAEAPLNLSTRNDESAVNLVSIYEASPEEDVSETITNVSPAPVPDAAEADEAPIESEEEIISENQNDLEEIQEPIEVEETIVLPNIFTPNNDGVNDFFEIQMSEKLDFQIIIIDPTNKVIFQSNLVDFRWDGTFPGGEPVPAGNYIYYLTAKTLSGKDFVKHSDLRIER
jgi:gliding motility-associated-like protein